MAIKVIKHGEKTFQTTCPLCGCIFEYETEDIVKDEDSLGKHYYVKCPDCGEIVVKLKYSLGPFKGDVLLDNAILTTKNINESSKGDPCETCPNRDGPKDVFGNPTVGDSPCQWCRHYKWRATW